MLVRHVKSYLRETTLHGLGYLAAEGGVLERVFWVAAIATSFSIAAIMASGKNGPDKVGHTCRSFWGGETILIFFSVHHSFIYATKNASPRICFSRNGDVKLFLAYILL